MGFDNVSDSTCKGLTLLYETDDFWEDFPRVMMFDIYASKRDYAGLADEDCDSYFDDPSEGDAQDCNDENGNDGRCHYPWAVDTNPFCDTNDVWDTGLNYNCNEVEDHEVNHPGIFGERVS